MKKVALTLASVAAATAFAPEASALPAFARQTGSACNACHQTHFPVLNAYGRAFKAGGYVMMGAQAKVEDEHLSIPAEMNAAILLKYRAQHDTQAQVVAGAGITAANSNGAEWQHQMGDEFSFFMAGRIAESGNLSIGFLNENNLGAAGAMPLVAGLRVPVNYDFGAAKVTVVPFSTDALGSAYGFELSSGGVHRANRWAEHRRETSAIQYNADRGSSAGNAAGIATVVQTEFGFINYTKWSSSFFPGANGGAVASTNFGQTYLRVAATPTVADWSIVAGAGIESGNSYGNLAAAQVESAQTFFDAQAHGQLAGMETGIYLQRAMAAACTVATAANCDHNTGVVSRDATTIGAEFQVLPHTLSLGVAYRLANNGKLVTGTTEAQTDNAATVTAVYDLVQNVALVANFSQYNGTAYNNTQGAAQLTTLMLEAAW
jgi:hypothetical protein